MLTDCTGIIGSNETGFEGHQNDRAYTCEAEVYGKKACLMARDFVETRPESTSQRNKRHPGTGISIRKQCVVYFFAQIDHTPWQTSDSKV